MLPFLAKEGRAIRGAESLRRRARERGKTAMDVLLGVAAVVWILLFGAYVFSYCFARFGCGRGQMDTTRNCMANLRQIGQASVAYYKDYDFWMVSGGNRAGELDEPPVSPPGNSDPDFPYWYEAFAPYINHDANRAKARKYLVQLAGKEPSEEQVREEIARMCMLFKCYDKTRATIGYGYNYAAPFGVDAVYKEKPALPKLWGKPGPVPVLWYGQSVHFGVLKNPGGQIAVCDTGLVTNDAELKTPPEEWEESLAANVTGYARFPLCDSYRKSAKYRSEKAWRPVARHKKRAVCLFFDGNVKPVNIRDIVDPAWGDRKCLFDNTSP